MKPATQFHLVGPVSIGEFLEVNRLLLYELSWYRKLK